MFILPVPKAKDTIFKILQPNFLFFSLFQALKSDQKCNSSQRILTTGLNKPL